MSSRFKKKYPKKYIICSIEKNQVYNVANLDDVSIPFSKFSYVFVNEKPMTKRPIKQNVKYISDFERSQETILRVYPMDLSNYLTNPKDNVVVKFYPKKLVSDPRLLNPIVITNTVEFLLKLDLKETFQQLIQAIYKEQKNVPKNTEEWLLDFLDSIPYGPDYSIRRFPSLIQDSLFKKKMEPKLSDFVFGYCIREKDVEKELKLIEYLEQDLSDLNADIRIGETYDSLLERLRPELKKNKIKFRDYKEFIVLKAKDFYSLKNFSFTMLDALR